MNARARFHVQTVGAWCVFALCASMFARGMPFLFPDPFEQNALRVRASVTDKHYEDLAGGPAQEGRGHFEVSLVHVADDGIRMAGTARVSGEYFDAVQVGDMVPALLGKGRLLSEEDLRWSSRARRATWMWMTASVLFLAEGLRRIVSGPGPPGTQSEAAGNT